MVRLLYVSCGSPDLHVQCLYAIHSALAFGGSAETQIVLYTDAPATFQPLANRVKFREVNAEQMRELRGPGDYPFRMKLAATREVARQFPSDPILYVDADTFFVRDYRPLVAQIDAQHALLHRREYLVSQHPTGQLRRFRRHMRRLAPGIDLSRDMWNSGVIGVHPAHFPALDEAIALIDRVSPHYKKALVEQYAVSLALQKRTQVLSAESYVFHYWFQKPAYQQVIAERLAQWKSLPPDDALAQLRANRIALTAPPAKRRFWQRVLERLSIREPLPEIRGLPRDM